jgi:hypothetical protein
VHVLGVGIVVIPRDGSPVFVPAPPLTDDDVGTIVETTPSGSVAVPATRFV